MSYFQAIARFKGYRYSKDNFKEFEYGLLDVFPEIQQVSPQDADIIVVRLWSSVRCGLYHNGLIFGRVKLTEEMKQPIGYDRDLDILNVNPLLLTHRLDTHFESYIEKLKDTNNNILKKNFEYWFDEVKKEEDKNFDNAKLKRQKRREKCF